MNNTDYIFNCPEATEFDQMPAEVQVIVKSLGAEWPAFYMPGTNPINSRKLLMVRLTTYMPKVNLEAMLSAHSLDWQIYSIRSAYTVENVDSEIAADYMQYYLEPKVNFLPFMNPILISETESRAVTLEDDIYLSTYAGTESIKL